MLWSTSWPVKLLCRKCVLFVFHSLLVFVTGILKLWSPSAAHPEDEFDIYATADGAGVSNTDLISLLQRNISTILAFVNTNTPMYNSTNWNPATDPLTETVVDFTVGGWFGKIPVDLSDYNNAAYDLNGSWVSNTLF